MQHSNSPIIFLSYPKCGRSWLFAIFGKYLAIKHNLPDKKSIDFVDQPDRFNLKPIKRTHAGFSYENPKKNLQKIISRQNNVILMYRGIYDTLVSYYHDCKDRKGYNQDIHKFIRNNEGVQNLIDFYNEVGDCKIIDTFSYENLFYRTMEEFERFHNIVARDQLDREIAHTAIDFCSFENLYNLERQKRFYMRGNKSFNKTRKGKIGSYKDELSNKDIDFINSSVAANKKNNEIWKLLE